MATPIPGKLEYSDYVWVAAEGLTVFTAADGIMGVIGERAFTVLAGISAALFAVAKFLASKGD